MTLKSKDVHKRHLGKYPGEPPENLTIGDFFQDEEKGNWVQLVQGLGDAWRKRLDKIDPAEFYVINDAELNEEGDTVTDETDTFEQWQAAKMGKSSLRERYTPSDDKDTNDGHKLREEDLLGILLKYTPPLLIACWAFFFNEVNKKQGNGYELPVAKLLCNRDDLQQTSDCSDLWKISQSLITMHAIADICCTGWGIKTVEETSDNKTGSKRVSVAQWLAERLLFDKGSLSTINPARGRILPKRHNPGVGITLRSISSNLGFHRSSIDVVWRKTNRTQLENKINEDGATFSLLLFPQPIDVRAKDFSEDTAAENRLRFDISEYGFFGFEPTVRVDNRKIINLIKKAKEELNQTNDRIVDAIVFPETALSKTEYEFLERDMQKELGNYSPSLFIAGVRESRKDVYMEFHKHDEKVKAYLKDFSDKHKELRNLTDNPNADPQEIKDMEKTIRNLEKKYLEESKAVINFARNAVYCKYFDKEEGFTTRKVSRLPRQDLTPKYKQYKHHRWRLDSQQIIRYGLSQILDNKRIWWEAIKIPRRRVSFLNVGENITISTLVCEDLARQDPIADLIRHVGPSLVITLLMDGPQVKSRWSGRYASILSDDPGCSVITLTSLGMVKRDTSFGLSRVIALWSQSHGERVQEIGIAEGAEAVLLVLKLQKESEVTADGRQEREPTTVLKLMDMIQVYPED